MSSLDSIPVSHVMSSPVKTIQENEIIQQACKTMVQDDIGSVIVVAAQSVNAQTPVGIITGKDIVKNLAERPISFSSPVNQLMSKPVVTIHPNAPLQDAFQTMQARNIRRLLVISDDGNNMTRIITDSDIIRYIARNESISSGLINKEVLARKRWLSVFILACLTISCTEDPKNAEDCRNREGQFDALSQSYILGARWKNHFLIIPPKGVS